MKTARIRADQITVVPPPLHPGQLEVLNHPARFKLLRAGRRWRKSGLGVVQAYTGYQGPNGREFLGALTGGRIGWWVPSLTKRYLVTDWEPIKLLAMQIPGTRIEEADHRVVMPSGGWILMLSGDDPDSGRGLGLDGAVVDEATLVQQQLWTETIRATLIDRQGWGMLLFTPKGLNWIYDLVQDAPTLPDWHAFHYTSQDNPYLDEAELESFTSEMSSLVYKQEILAEFVTGGAGMFHRDWFQHYYVRFEADERMYMLGEEAVKASQCRFFHTVDLAWSLDERADYTVISSWAVTPKTHLLLLDVIRGRFEGPDIIPKMRLAFEKFGGYLVVERATRQMSIIQEAERVGLPVKEAPMGREKGSDAKIARALPATARMERKTVWFPPAGVDWYRAIEEELLAFPAGQHDDFVDTLSYAVAEVTRPSSALVTF